MASPASFTTSLPGPQPLWTDSAVPPAEGCDSLLATMLTALGVGLALLESVARKGPWELTGPLELAAQPLSLSAGWLVGGAMAALAAGVLVGRGRRGAHQNGTEPAVPRLPVFLRFDGRPVVVVGGGAIAAAKIPALLAAGATVTVIAPEVSPVIDRGRVRVIQRRFEPTDLDGAWFVTAAANPVVNRQVRDAAEARAILVNAVDDPANGTAYLGGTIARGGVTLAVSTAGKAPALAGLLREALDAVVPHDIDTWVARAHALSQQQRADGVPMAERRPQLLDALNELYAARGVPQADSGRHA